ncbi:MAG: hypothetical protein K2P80_02985 [Beijerinckiaceae bacterium]|nr:hypothetical protein [Beijerinckiaceae bacterium]
MRALVIACLLALPVMGCQSQQTGVKTLAATGETFEEPAKAGQTKIRLANVDRDRWTSRLEPVGGGQQTVYVCKPLACSTQTVVIFKRIASPTRNPDPVALDKLLAAIRAKAESDGATFVSEKRTTIKGFPALQSEYKRTINDKTLYTAETIIFSGGISSSIVGASSDAAAAKRYRDEFVSKYQVNDGGSLSTVTSAE